MKIFSTKHAVLCAAVLLASWQANAQTSSTRAQLESNINAEITTNGTGQITGAILNKVLQDQAASTATLLDANSLPLANLQNITGPSLLGSATSGSTPVSTVPLGSGVATALGIAPNAAGGFVSVPNTDSCVYQNSASAVAGCGTTLPSGLTIPNPTVTGTFTLGTIGMSDNSNNQVAFASGKSIQLNGFGSLQVAGNVGGALIANDNTSNDVVINPSTVTNVDTDLVINPPSGAGAYLAVNSNASANQQTLILGSRGNSATYYELSQTKLGTGVYLPVYLSGGATHALELTTDPFVNSLVPFNAQALLTLTGAESSQLAWSLGGQLWKINEVSGANLYFYDQTNGKFPLTLHSAALATLDIGETVTIGGGGSAAVGVLGEEGFAKIVASGVAPGTGFLKIAAVAGTSAGTCKLIAYAGTSTTPTTIVDNVGAGC